MESDDLFCRMITRLRFLVCACARMLEMEREVGLVVHRELWRHAFGGDLYLRSGWIYVCNVNWGW